AVRFEGITFRLKDSKGLHVLSRLLENPGREFHALDLAGAASGVADGGDAGELLDERAIGVYRRRVETLDDIIAEAESFGDPDRATRARDERAQIAAELSRAVGFGGHKRRAGSAAERARTAVQRRLRDVIDRIAEQSPPLGRHLEHSVRTGTFCSYEPEPEPQ